MERLKIVPDASPDIAAAAQLRIYALGPPRLVYRGEPYLLHGRPKLWPLLALLALHDGEPLARERVAALLWPDAPGDAARSNLRRHLSYLEAALPPLEDGTWLARAATHVGFDAQRRVWIDARGFVEAGSSDERLREAVDSYRGDFLGGIDDEWANVERERLRERYLFSLDRLIEIERRAGEVAAALQHGVEALRHDPYREDAVRTVMRLHAERGDRAGALRAYEQFAALLRADLSAEPAAATAALYDAVANEAPMPADVRALPLEHTSFVGRAAELRQLEAATADARIVSVVGPPGIGKTRLVLHAAHALAARFRDGARFVDASRAVDEPTLAAAIAASCEERARERPEAPVPLEERLRRKHLLLVLDNVENVAAVCARLATRIVRAAPGLTIVATSRVVLDAPGEAVVRLEPLPPPDALRLFIDRARLARADFSPSIIDTDAARTIARGTDGLPLALELAAARLRTLTLGDIVARLARPLRFLGDEPDRRDEHVRTLRASLAASYALLGPGERRLFRRLSVFAGGASVEAARTICLDDADDWTTLAMLARLVDHSLVVPPRVAAPEQRFDLLRSIAEFAEDRLAAEDDAPAVRATHARSFARRYVALNDDVRGPHAHRWYESIARDHDDLRRALDVLLDGGVDPALGARLALALSRFWFDRGFASEGAHRLESALSHALDAPLRASVLHCLATLIRNQGDYAQAYALFGEALELVRAGGDDIAIGKALATSSNAARMVAAYDEAIVRAAEAHAHFARTGDVYLCAYARITSGCAAFSAGDVGAARRAFEDALDGYRRTGAEPDIALALGNLALCAYYDGDDAQAATLASEAAERAAALDNHYYHANALLTRARVAARGDDPRTANGDLGRALALALRIDDKELQLAATELAASVVLADDARLAATLLGAVDAARERINAPRGAVELPEYDALAAALDARLGPGGAAALRRTGAALDPAAAVARASGALGYAEAIESTSMSKISVAFGGITPPAPAAP